MTDRYRTSFRLIRLNMRFFLPGHQPNPERYEDIDEDMAAALDEVRYNMPRLKASTQAVKDVIMLRCHLARSTFDFLDRTEAIRWIRNNKIQKCKDVVDRTIQLTEYVIEKTLEGTLEVEAVKAIILSEELRLSNEVMDLVAAYNRYIRDMLNSRVTRLERNLQSNGARR